MATVRCASAALHLSHLSRRVMRSQDGGAHMRAGRALFGRFFRLLLMGGLLAASALGEARHPLSASVEV